MIHPTRILLTAAFSLLSVLSVQAAPTRIVASQIISVPGSYVLANDITGSGGVVIEIQTSNVTLNLNGHTVNASDEGIAIDANDINNNRAPVVNVHVSNGRVVAAAYGVSIAGSYCLVNGLNVTVGASGIPIPIRYGNYNRVSNCVLSAATGQTGRAAFSLFLTSHNTIQDNTLTGIYVDTIEEDDQAGASVTVAGDNTFSGNQFANPTQ